MWNCKKMDPAELYKSMICSDDSSSSDEEEPKLTPLLKSPKSKRMRKSEENDNILSGSDEDSESDEEPMLTVPVPGDINSRKQRALRAGVPHMRPNDNPLEFKSETKLCIFFLSLVNKSRGNVEWSNLMIGASLKNIFGDGGLEYWKSFNPTNTEGMFRKIRNQSRTIKTLAWFARLDNPTKYHAWHSNWCSDATDLVIDEDGSFLALGILLSRFAWLDYLSIDQGSKKVGYFYKNHGWNRESSPDFLNNMLITKVKRFLKIKGGQLLKKQKFGNKESKTESKVSVMETIVKKKIGDMHSRITQEAMSLLTRNEFIALKSSNLSMIRMKNLVIETTYNGIYTRDGTPEDMLTMCTNIDYPVHMTMDSPEVHEREKWCFQTFGSDGLSEALQTDMASFARGGNEDKLFRSWVGAMGNNSKSMHVECMSIAFGEYMKSLPVSALSGQAAGQGAANAEIARTEGAFIVVAKEPEANEYIHGGRVKGFTGGIDHIYVRGIYEQGREIVISWKLMVMTNHDMPIGQGGKALDNRMMITPFESEYTEEAPFDYEEQKRLRRFKMDKHFGDKLPDMAAAYWFLTVNKYFPIYLEKSRAGLVGCKLHPEIQKRTIKFNRQNNLVLKFWDNMVERHNSTGVYDHNFTLNTLDAFSKFVDFCASENIKQNQMIGMDLFAADFLNETSKLGIENDNAENHQNKRYFGISLKQGAAFG